MTSAVPATKPTVGTSKPTTTATTITTTTSESVTEETPSTWKPSTEQPSTTEDPWAWKPTTTTAATLPTTQSQYHLTGEADARTLTPQIKSILENNKIANDLLGSAINKTV